MNKIKYIFPFFLLLFLFGCEKSSIVDIPLPYEEDVVVQGQLVADTLFQGVKITKTIPVNETYDINKAQIKNAFVYLRINGVQIVPLHYVSDGIYMPVNTLYVMSGNTFEVFGRANGTEFYGRTIIPDKPVIVSSEYNQSGKYMEATVKVNAGEVYGSVWSIGRSGQTTGNDFYSIISPDNNAANITTRTSVLPDIYQSSFYDDRRYIQVFAFDKQYQAFFTSKGNNQPVSNYFIQGGGSVAWNVYGDHVIGLFIGVTKSNL